MVLINPINHLKLKKKIINLLLELLTYDKSYKNYIIILILFSYK